jgi:sucrose phosphorylase
MLALVGVPGIYVHSLYGSHNDHVGMAETGRARTINRQKWLRAEIDAVMENPGSHSHRIFRRYTELLKIRAEHAAFHPNGDQQILGGNPAIFALRRTAPDGSEQVLCLHNITARPQTYSLDAPARDLLTGETTPAGGIELAPYAVKWLA